MEGEWGPTDKSSSVVTEPPKLHIANLGSGSCNETICDLYIKEVAMQKQDNIPVF